VAQQPDCVLGRRIGEVSRTHTQSVGLLCKSDQLIAEAATYATDTRDEHPRDSNPNPSKRTMTADARLGPHGHWDQQ